jgi:hypothetical protein
LKGLGNETDFLGFLQKSVPHESLALPFEQFRFWPQIHGDIHNQKTTSRLAELGRRQDFLELAFFQTFKKSIVIVHYISGFFFANLVL